MSILLNVLYMCIVCCSEAVDIQPEVVVEIPSETVFTS